VPYFALLYDLVGDFLPRRAALRPEHLALAQQSFTRGEMVLGGAFFEPTDRALIIFRAPSKSVPEAFAQNDPYVRNGLVKKWEVRAWNVVIGNAE